MMEKTPESFPERFDYMNTGKPVGVWSAARTIFRGLALREAGTPDEAAEQELHEMPFTNCRCGAVPEKALVPESRVTQIEKIIFPGYNFGKTDRKIKTVGQPWYACRKNVAFECVEAVQRSE